MERPSESQPEVLHGMKDTKETSLCFDHNRTEDLKDGKSEKFKLQNVLTMKATYVWNRLPRMW